MPDALQVKKDILDSVRAYYETVHAEAEEQVDENTFIQFAGRVFDNHEIENLVDSSLEFWLTHGRYVRKFESELAKRVNCKHCLFVNSGSSANLLAFSALTSYKLKDRRILPGDEVITTACCFPTTVSPIIQNGAIPVFVDIDASTGNLEPSLLEKALSQRTKAVVIAHTLGNPFHIEKIKTFCQKHKLWLIEDNCDALGAQWKNKPTGSFGDIGTSSFFPAHHITTGEGGAVYTNNSTLNKILLSFRDWGRDCWCEPGKDNTCGARFSQCHGNLPEGYDHKYVYSHFGYNLKGTEMQAAIGCAQLGKLDQFIEKRNQNWKHLQCHLDNTPWLTPLESYHDASPSWFGYYLSVDSNAPFKRNEITAYLESHKIQTRNLFAGNIIKHPCFSQLTEGVNYKIASPLPNTDSTLTNGFWVGVYPKLTPKHLDKIISTIKAFVSQWS